VALIGALTVGAARDRTEATTLPPGIAVVAALTQTTNPAGTAPATATPTSLPSIRNRIPVPPSTLPLQTRALSTHISPVFAALSGAGFFVALVIMATCFVLTRPRRRRRQGHASG
jgi:hypothetical protein